MRTRNQIGSSLIVIMGFAAILAGLAITGALMYGNSQPQAQKNAQIKATVGQLHTLLQAATTNAATLAAGKVGP